MSDDFYLNIDTPENVVFGYEVAGIGSRFLATLLDSILIVILMIIAYITAGLLLSAAGPDNFGPAAFAIFGLIAFASLFPIMSVMGYAQISEWRYKRDIKKTAAETQLKSD